MTKDELIEALRDLPGDTRVSIDGIDEYGKRMTAPLEDIEVFHGSDRGYYRPDQAQGRKPNRFMAILCPVSPPDLDLENDMKIGAWMVEQKARLDRFHDWYMRNRNETPDDFPMAMPESDWNGEFRTFCFDEPENTSRV